MGECYVSAADYRRYWLGEPDPVLVGALRVWTGEDRRVAVTDRRIRDRRDPGAKGRRYRLSDRRRMR